MAESRYARERQHPRLDELLAAHLRLCGGRQVLPVTIRNLSAGGAALLASCKIPVHSTVEELRFALPPMRQQRGAFIAVSAIVRWNAEQPSGPYGPRHLHGLEFLDLEGSALTRVRNYVYYRLVEPPAAAAGRSPTNGQRSPDLHLTQSLPA